MWLFGEKIKNISQVLASSTQPQIWSIPVIRELTQQEGRKTQDGRMTSEKNSREIGNAQSPATFFRHSNVLSLPTVLLLKLPISKEMYQNAKRTCRACRAFVFVH